MTPLLHSVLLEPLSHDLLEGGQELEELAACQDPLWLRTRDRPFYSLVDLLAVKEQVGGAGV